VNKRTTSFASRRGRDRSLRREASGPKRRAGCSTARPAHTTDTHSSQTTTVRSSYIHNTTCAHRYRYTLCTLRQLHPNPAQAIDGGDQRTKDRRWMAAPGCLHRCQRSRHPLGLPRTLRRLKSNESQTYIAPRRQSAAVVDPGPFKPTSLVQDRITSIP
jgi:hypothetical protein